MAAVLIKRVAQRARVRDCSIKRDNGSPGLTYARPAARCKRPVVRYARSPLLRPRSLASSAKQIHLRERRVFLVDNRASAAGKTGAKDYGIRFSRVCTECLLLLIVQSHLARAIFDETEFRGWRRVSISENNFRGILLPSKKGKKIIEYSRHWIFLGYRIFFSGKKARIVLENVHRWLFALIQ